MFSGPKCEQSREEELGGPVGVEMVDDLVALCNAFGLSCLWLKIFPRRLFLTGGGGGYLRNVTKYL